MSDKIKFKIISDVVCPWCIIGYKRLEQAIFEMGIQDKIEIEWQPFELNPDMPAECEDVLEHIVRKYGTTPNESSSTLAQMTSLGAELGFTFDFFDGIKMVNTLDLHILLDYAKEEGKQTDLKMRLFTAFFSERKDVSDRQILAQEIQSIGLNKGEALTRLEDETARKQVQTQETYWKNLGVSAVPTVVFSNSSSLSGAQPIDLYKQVLRKLIEQ